MHTDIYMCTYIHIHTYTYIYIYIYIHTYIPTCIPSWISGPRLRDMPMQLYATECAAQVSTRSVINPAPHRRCRPQCVELS